MVDEKKIGELLDVAIVAGLEGTDFVTSFDVETLQDGYNGIGPQFLPPRIRDRVTDFLSIFEAAALIHDLRFSKGDGSRSGFNYANWEFFRNCRKLAKQAYPWYSWRRYRALAVADALADAVCSDGGWSAWRSASTALAQVAFFAFAAAVALALGCAGIPKAKDVSLGGMYANAATETVAIGKAKITTLPESIESFVAHYSEDTAWLSPTTKTRFLDIYMTGTNSTSAASNVVDTICRAFVEMKGAGNGEGGSPNAEAQSGGGRGE